MLEGVRVCFGGLSPLFYSRNAPSAPFTNQKFRVRPARAAAHQDLAGSRLADGHRLSGKGRPPGAARRTRLRARRLRLHDLYRQCRRLRPGVQPGSYLAAPRNANSLYPAMPAAVADLLGRCLQVDVAALERPHARPFRPWPRSMPTGSTTWRSHSAIWAVTNQNPCRHGRHPGTARQQCPSPDFPDTAVLDLSAGDRLLLCTDGLTNRLGDREIRRHRHRRCRRRPRPSRRIPGVDC